MNNFVIMLLVLEFLFFAFIISATIVLIFKQYKRKKEETFEKRDN
jgi:hypothetical protein